MPLDGIGIMLDCFSEVTSFNIHRLNSESAFLFL